MEAVVPPPTPEDSVPDVELDRADAVVALVASALASVAVAEASVAWAEITSASRSATSSDARVWPETTVWPTGTSTELTVPETLKFRFAWFTGVMVATESNVAATVPVPTADVR